MKILYNCSTNIVGGAVQTATNFILQCIQDNDKNITWYFIVSRVVFEQLKKFNVTIDNIYIIEISPARNIKERKQINNLEKILNPDIIYTMSGPAYVNFNRIHILGCTNPYVMIDNWFSFEWKMGLKEIISNFFGRIYKSFYFKKADYWIFQTDSSRNGFVKWLKVPKDKTFVVPNACGKHYQFMSDINCKNDDVLSFFIPSADFPHKNLEIVPYVARKLKEQIKLKKINKKFEFVLTLPFNCNGWKKLKVKSRELGVEENIRNNGSFSITDGPLLYQQSFATFLPTFLEVFSGVFVESLASKKPLIVSDRSFSRDVCKDAAIYFEPTSIDSAVEAILKLIEMSKKERAYLINKGYDIINIMPNVKERYEMIKKILVDVGNMIYE